MARESRRRSASGWVSAFTGRTYRRDRERLGLSIVRRIAEIYGAAVAFDTSPGGQGLCVTVRFPAAHA